MTDPSHTLASGYWNSNPDNNSGDGMNNREYHISVAASTVPNHGNNVTSQKIVSTGGSNTRAPFTSNAVAAIPHHPTPMGTHNIKKRKHSPSFTTLNKSMKLHNNNIHDSIKGNIHNNNLDHTINAHVASPAAANKNIATMTAASKGKIKSKPNDSENFFHHCHTTITNRNYDNEDDEANILWEEDNAKKESEEKEKEDDEVEKNNNNDEVNEKTGPIVSSGLIDFAIVKVHDHLICRLCHGYFRDPYTITECLHTFCKSCLFFAIQSGYRRCPSCDTSLEPDPFKEILCDRTLQTLVDKIFPHLKEQDAKEETAFYKRRGIKLKRAFQQEFHENYNQQKCTVISKPQQQEQEQNRPTVDLSSSTNHNNNDNDNNMLQQSNTTATTKLYSNTSRNVSKELLSTKKSAVPSHNQKSDNQNKESSNSSPNNSKNHDTYESEEEEQNSKPKSVPSDELNFHLISDMNVSNEIYMMPPLDNHMLRSSGRLKVSQLKKFLIRKLKLKKLPAAVEITCNGDPLGNELSLKFVQRTRWLNPSQDLTLYYCFGEESD